MLEIGPRVAQRSPMHGYELEALAVLSGLPSVLLRVALPDAAAACPSRVDHRGGTDAALGAPTKSRRGKTVYRYGRRKDHFAELLAEVARGLRR